MLAVGNNGSNAGRDRRRFDTTPPQFYCGLAVPARRLDVCIVRHAGELLVHRPMPAAPDPFRQARAPSRDGLVVAVAGLFPWSGRADRGAQEPRLLVLGHALSRKARHGGTATTETIASPPLATVQRGGR